MTKTVIISFDSIVSLGGIFGDRSKDLKSLHEEIQKAWADDSEIVHIPISTKEMDSIVDRFSSLDEVVQAVHRAHVLPKLENPEEELKFIVLGYSYGGVLAFEYTKYLEEKHEIQSRLGILDSLPKHCYDFKSRSPAGSATVKLVSNVLYASALTCIPLELLCGFSNMSDRALQSMSYFDLLSTDEEFDKAKQEQSQFSVMYQFFEVNLQRALGELPEEQLKAKMREFELMSKAVLKKLQLLSKQLSSFPEEHYKAKALFVASSWEINELAKKFVTREQYKEPARDFSAVAQLWEPGTENLLGELRLEGSHLDFFRDHAPRLASELVGNLERFDRVPGLRNVM